MDPREIIIQPIVTEKATLLSERVNKKGTPQNSYIFKVNPRSSKIEIRQAIEAIFRVKVKDVQTLWRRGKIRRNRKGGTSRLSDIKRAIVTLREGNKIELR